MWFSIPSKLYKDDENGEEGWERDLGHFFSFNSSRDSNDSFSSPSPRTEHEMEI